MQCAPYNASRVGKVRRTKSTSSTHHESCFFKKQLITIANALEIDGVGLRSTKATLWKAINETMQRKYGCESGNEHCWIEQNDRAGAYKESFVPNAPEEWSANPEAWLSNFDILNVLTQYEKRYPSFKFIGVFPINFSQRDPIGRCISKEICALNLKALKRYTSFGAVFNLDRHDQPGSHWVCTYFSLSEPNRGFYYFDSNAEPMPIEIRRFADSIRAQVKSPETFEIRENQHRKQFGNNECGMFCIHFIIMCLRRRSFDDITECKFYDKHANALRKELFRTKSKK